MGRKRADEKIRHAPTQLPEVKEFVRRVAEAPLDEIGGILEGFTWKYEKVRGHDNALTSHPGGDNVTSRRQFSGRPN